MYDNKTMTSLNYGLNDRLKYYELYLDSLDSGAGGNAQMPEAAQFGARPTDWPQFYINGRVPFKNIAAFKILELQAPFSYYVFVLGNSSWTVTEDGYTPFTVSLLPADNQLAGGGNFTATEICTNIAQALTDASLAHGGHFTYTVTYDHTTLKFSFYNNSTVDHPFSFTFGLSTNSGNTNPRLFIGFPGGVTTSQTFDALNGGNRLLAPNAQSVSGPNYFYLNSLAIGPDVDCYLPYGAFNLSGGNSGPQIAKVPIQVQSDGVIYWSDPDPQKWFNLSNKNGLLKCDFFFTLGNTRTQLPLSFNGQNFSLKVGLLLYDEAVAIQPPGLQTIPGGF